MTAVDTATAVREAYSLRYRLPLYLGPLLNPINTTMISVALVPISHDLGVPSSTVVWLVAGLYLTSAIAQPTLGRVGDILGARRVYLGGLVLCAVAGLLPTLFPGFTPVVVSRILLGLGTSAAYPSVMSLFRSRSREYGVQTPQTVLSTMSLVTLSSTAVGPPLGGLLIGLFGWQSIFLVNIPLALLALVGTLLWVPRPSREADEPTTASLRDLDPVGIVLFAASVASLLFFAIDLETPHWWLLVVAGLAVVALVVWELRLEGPFIDFRMLAANSGLTRTYLRMLTLYLGFYSVMYGYTQWIQDAAGFTPSHAGLLQLPQAVLAGLMTLAIRKTERVLVPIVTACVAAIVGGAILVVLHAGSPLAVLLIVTGLFGVAQGLTSVSNQLALYRQSPPDRQGTAAGLSRTAVYLGAILSSGVLGATFGDAPTDADIHLLGTIVVACSAVALAITVTDRTLRGQSSRRTP